jgi:Fe-S-cluster containining protein
MENKCSIYSVRPFTCRNLHSTDYDSCEKSHIDPTDLTIENSFIERVALFGSAHSQGFEAAAQQAGLDSRTYDLNTALVEVFEEPAAIKRFRRAKKAFLKAIEVKDDEQNA